MTSRRDEAIETRATEYAVVVIGALLVALGVAYQSATSSSGRPSSLFDQVTSGVLLALGGGILGAGLNSFIVRKYERNILGEIRDLVENSIPARFTSDETDLQIFRHEWHHYYLTQVGDARAWWYETCLFDRNTAVGSITQQTRLRDMEGQDHEYLTEVGVRGQRLILLETRVDGGEASGVEVFPRPRGFQSVHTGIACLETWSGAHILTKTVFSRKSLFGSIPKGRLTEDQAATLDQTWVEDFYRHSEILIDPKQ